MYINKFKGLNLQSNSFDNQETGLEVAENVLLSRDNIIQKRNGYGTFLEGVTAVPLALADYKNKIVLFGSTYAKILI